MIGEEPSPSRFERAVLAIPDGALLRLLFLGLVALTGFVLLRDVSQVWRSEADAARTTRTEPLPLRRPIPGDQRRPYLPRTAPVGPDRGAPTLPGRDGPVEGEAMGRPMDFVREPGTARISAVGRIDPGTAGLFADYLAGEGEGAGTLYLHSPGGSVADAIAMSRAVREAGIDTVVPDDGYCASACPLLFSGGVAREVGENAWVGVHQVYSVDTPALTRDVDRSISDIQATSADAQDLLVEMGVDPRLWIHAMRTPPAELYVLTPDEMEELGLVTPPPEPESEPTPAS